MSHIAAATLHRDHRLHFNFLQSHRILFPRTATFRHLVVDDFKIRAFSTDETEPHVTADAAKKLPDKPPICTADELHYVLVDNSKWSIALWRYNPSPEAPRRKHPLLLLSGLGTNAIGYDLSHGSSFARYMCGQGFDTWILEVRGAGLSAQQSGLKDVQKSADEVSEKMEIAVENATNGEPPMEQQSILEKSEIAVVSNEPPGIAMVVDESRLVTELTETFMRLSERLSGFLSETQSNIMFAKLFDQISKLLEDSFIFERFIEIRGKILNLLETRENSGITGQIMDLSQRLVDIVGEGQRSLSPQLFDLQGRLMTTVDDFQKQLDLIVKYDWDFDHYLEEDVPSAVRWNT